MLEEWSLQNNDFTEILSIISKAQTRALASVNREMITMYWEIGMQSEGLSAKRQHPMDGERALSLLLQHFSNRVCQDQVVFQIRISGE